MNKLAGIEDSGVTDRITGRRVLVTVTARKKFRQANPGWAKVRNNLLNAAIATDFARAVPQEKPFRVRSDPQSVGQVRDGFGGQYIAIIDSTSVKVITVGKGGTPKISVPAPVQMPSAAPVPAPQEQVAAAANEFSFFVIKHAVENLSSSMGLNSERLNTVVDLLSERTGLSVAEIIKKLEQSPRGEISDTLSLLCGDGQAEYLHTTEDKNSQITDPLYEMQSALPSSALALQVGLSQR